jgi:hypothetical protein
MTNAELIKLEGISRRISAQHASCMEFKEALLRDINATLAEAVLCGYVLKEARGIIGAAGFPDWLKKHCRLGIGEAEQLMQLAKSAPKLDTYNPRVLKSACQRLDKVWGQDTVQLSSIL